MVSLASRRWRSTRLPWGAVVLLAAAATAMPAMLLLSQVVVVAVVELPRRSHRLVEVLAIFAAALATWTLAGRGAPPSLLVVGSFAVLLSGTLLLTRQLPTGRPSGANPWAETAAALILLASAILMTNGLLTGDLLLSALGVVIPAALPALVQQRADERLRRLQVQTLAAVSHAMIDVVSGDLATSLDRTVRRLHQSLAPTLGQRATVLALNPAAGVLAHPVATCGVAEDDLPRLYGRARFLFESQRGKGVRGPLLTGPADSAHLHPRFASQLLVPVRRGRQIVALLALLGDSPLMEDDLLPTFAGAIAELIDHLLVDLETTSRLVTLERRNEQQGRRLGHLLELTQLVHTAPDLRSACSGLTRAVDLGFGFAWTGLLLRLDHGRLRLTATSGSGPSPSQSGEKHQLSSAALASVLELGTPVSRSTVVPVSSWPLPLPEGPRSDGLLLLPLGNGTGELGFLACLPPPELPVPDLEDLRALEILVEQVAPVIATTAHLEELHRQSLLDGLTGVANRRSLDLYLERALRDISHRGSCASLAMVDIDDFKQVNDRFGHRIGDVVLRELAAVLVKNLRTMDFISRYGGEEFCLVLPGLDATRSVAVLRRLLEIVGSTPFASAELSHPLRLTVSIGVATYPDDGEEVRSLLDRADLAMYRAKSQGKNRVVWSALLGDDDAYFESEEPFSF